MELKDYVNKVEEEKKKQLPAWVKIYQNIDFSTMPEEKLKLIKSFNDYIINYNFNEYAAIKEKNAMGYIMQQVKTQNNSTAGALIEIKNHFKRSTGYDDYDSYEPLDEQEYQARTSKFQLEGSQEFFKLYIGIDGGFSSTYIKSNNLYFGPNLSGGHIFYSKDGKVFITQKLVDAIKIRDTGQLGMFLAQEAIKIKQKKYPN